MTFAAFDVLHLAGESTIDLPWAKRRDLLELLELNDPAWVHRADLRR